MKKLTEFLGKPVISLLEGNIQGYVKNVALDKTFKKVKYFILFEDNDFQDEKMLDCSKVYNYSKDAIIVKNDSALELKKDEVLQIENHINCKVYSTSGEYIGLVSDVTLNDDLSTLNILLSDGQAFTPTDFLTFGEDIFIKQDENNMIKISNVRKKDNILKSTQVATKVSILPKQSQNEDTSKQEDVQTNTQNAPTLPIFPEPTTDILATKKRYLFNEQSVPKKLILSNCDFLIGRKTTKTIYSPNNEVIVKKNMLITSKIVQNAVIYNKLRELAIYSA